MKKIYDIFEQFQNDSTKTIKENFANLLKEYIHAQYKGANENEIFKKFALDFEKETGHQANKDWINPKKIGGISRKSILEIAFVLNQNSNNGEEICNNLLQTMHFPRIHARVTCRMRKISAFDRSLLYPSRKFSESEHGLLVRLQHNLRITVSEKRGGIRAQNEGFRALGNLSAHENFSEFRLHIRFRLNGKRKRCGRDLQRVSAIVHAEKMRENIS